MIFIYSQCYSSITTTASTSTPTYTFTYSGDSPPIYTFTYSREEYSKYCDEMLAKFPTGQTENDKLPEPNENSMTIEQLLFGEDGDVSDG